MRVPHYSSATLVSLLRERKVATLEEMKRSLGTHVDLTVFRLLREVPYVSSYSHSGKYYVLRSVARFNERGLWTWQGVHFSRHGSLVDTAEQWVLSSPRGVVAGELDAALQVETKGALLGLFRKGRLARERIAGVYVYLSPAMQKRREQVLARSLEREPFRTSVATAPLAMGDETKAAIVLFFSVLDEKQRRLYAGLESVRLGRGGDRRISELTGMDVHTIAKGREELLAGQITGGRVRQPGGGRHRLEKKLQT